MTTIGYKKNDVPVSYETDVLVVGGGLGGVAAALAAARAGASVILAERNMYLGGVATAGMCCSVYNCLCTQSGEVAVSGIPLEIVDALACRADGPGKSWKKHKGHIIYDVEKAKLILGELLEQAGVSVLYGLPVCGAIMEGSRVCGAFVAGRNGIEAIRARNVVDASGDADMAYHAGAPLKTKMNKQSYVFRIGGVDVDAFVDYFRKNPNQYPSKMDVNWSVEDALKQYDENGTFLFPHGGGFQNDIINEAVKDGLLKQELGSHNSLCATQMHGIRDKNVMHIITGYTDLESLAAGEISRAVMDGRRMAFHVMEFLRRRMPGFENAFVSASADDLGIRNSRSIDGSFEFTREMKESAVRFDDAVGVGVAEAFRVLNSGKDAWSAQVLTDDLYEVPLRCMLPKGVEGLIMGAGRSISPLLRVMVVTMIVGQGAGAAAAVASKAGKTVRECDYAEVRRELEKMGVRFPS